LGRGSSHSLLLAGQSVSTMFTWSISKFHCVYSLQ
jgi:hypothetical protein